MNEQTLALLRRRAQVALDTWVEEWAVGQRLPVALTVGTEIDPADWQSQVCHQLRDAHGGLWLRANAADRARLTQCIFGDDPRTATADAIAEITSMAALARAEALWAALFGESSLPIAQPVTHLPAELLAPGSRTVEMVCAPFGLRAIVDAGVWRALPSTPMFTSTLVICLLDVQSSPASNEQAPATEQAFDTVQYYASESGAWHIKTFALDQEVHVWPLGRNVLDIVEHATADTQKRYGKVVRTCRVFKATGGVDGLRIALVKHEMAPSLEVDDAGCVYWTPHFSPHNPFRRSR